MTFWQFVVRSLLFYRRINLSVALGVAAATAVLTGALLVGDSVRESLRKLALERLGKIDEVLVRDRFFRAELADEVRASGAFEAHYSAVTPTILLPSVTLAPLREQNPRQAANVLLIGADEAFWEFGNAGSRPAKAPRGDEVVLNQPLAEALEVEVGDEIVLRLPKISDVPADSPLGRKGDRVETYSGLKVSAIIPAAGLGRFALRPSQGLPRNAYLATEKLQTILSQPGKVNTLLLAGKSPDQPPDAAASDALASDMLPRLEDLGVKLERVTLRYPQKEPTATIYDYAHLTTERMIFSPEMRKAIEAALKPQDPHPSPLPKGEGAGKYQPAITYLANTIALGDSKTGVPYSTIAAIDSDATGPAVDEQGNAFSLAADEIVLNRWTAEDLGAKLGDKIRIDYFSPETTHGKAIETSATFTLKAIVPLTEPAAGFTTRGREQTPAVYRERPTPANDWQLTPVVKGVTDQQTIKNWNPPFPYDQDRIRTPDDTYWENHRATPKAFISYAAGQKLWGSRFGDATSFRIPLPKDATDADVDALRAQVQAAIVSHRQQLGFAPLRIKQQNLDAAKGTTPFDVLFLFLSFFIIAAALMLVSVLFKLGVDQRVREVGTLLAIGWQRRLTGRALLAEGVIVAALGGALGVAIGIGYSRLMIWGLTTWWVGAISTPFLEPHATWRSLAIGFVSGVVVCSLTIAWSLRQLRLVSARELLAGRSQPYRAVARRSVVWNLVAGVLVLAALGLMGLAATLGGEAQAGAFVGGGAAMLTAALLFIWNGLRAPANVSAASAARLSLERLAIGAAQRNPGRSTLTIGLMAAACFLIVALGSFRLDPSQSGAGGFQLVATTSDPIFADLNTPAGRREQFAEPVKALDAATILGLRYRAGDDASCNNLYQATQPRIIGATPAFSSHYDQQDGAPFSFAASAATTEEEKKNPWRLLDAIEPADGKTLTPALSQGEREPESIPVILDKNTAMYSLHLYRGIGEEFPITYDDGTTLKFRVVGLLSNSILQGSLVIGEHDFVAHFPETSGYRYFLIGAPDETALADAKAALADRLSDQGFDPQRTDELLAELLRVQNTYLSTFQSLGALGLLLGTFGLATVQLRSVLERRAELALLRAAGFGKARIARLVLTESALLLVGGLATGVVAALAAVVPHIVIGGANIRLDELLLMLGGILIVGLLASLIAVRATLATNIIAALRGE